MPEPESEGYERRDMDSRTVLWFGVGLIGALILSFVIVRIFAVYLGGGSPAAGRVLPPHAEIAGPRLQANPTAELVELRRAEEAKLHDYGWVDREAGVIRMPIEKAMELTLQRGLPAREARKEGAP